MTHTTEIIAVVKLGNGQIRATIRCCGNASTDYMHTMDYAGDAAQRLANLNSAQAKCAENHQSQMDLETQTAALVGQTETHSL
jgi:hypothetical protein